MNKTGRNQKRKDERYYKKLRKYIGFAQFELASLRQSIIILEVAKELKKQRLAALVKAGNSFG